MPPRLRLEPRPSRIGCILLAAACAMTAVLLGMLPLPVAGLVGGALATLAVLAGGLWRCTGRGVPALLQVGIDRRITVTDCKGQAHAGSILDDSYVGAWLTTIVWRAEGRRWWRPARTILVLPDTLPRDDYRRLRVVLRYGRPVEAEGTRGADDG